jgi:hypothetical protein
MELSDAERQMVELLRSDKHITLTINQDGRAWHMRLEDHDSGLVGDGHGPTFDRAWDDIATPHLRRGLRGGT